VAPMVCAVPLILRELLWKLEYVLDPMAWEWPETGIPDTCPGCRTDCPVPDRRRGIGSLLSEAGQRRARETPSPEDVGSPPAPDQPDRLVAPPSPSRQAEPSSAQVAAPPSRASLPHEPPRLSSARAPPQAELEFDQSPAFDLTAPEPIPQYEFDQSPPQDWEI